MPSSSSASRPARSRARRAPGPERPEAEVVRARTRSAARSWSRSVGRSAAGTASMRTTSSRQAQVRSRPRRCRPERRPRAAARRRGRARWATRWMSAGATASTSASASSSVRTSIVERLLAADPRRDVAGLVHPQLEATGEVALGLVQLGRAGRLVAQAGELGEDRVERLRQAAGSTPAETSTRAGVGVVDEPGRRRRRPGRAPRGRTGTGGCSSRRRGPR